MVESIDSQRFAKHITRFFDDPDDAAVNIARLIAQNPNISKAEIFREVSKDRGQGSTHASKYQAPHYDGKMKGS